MVSVCIVPAREGRLCRRFSGYKTINRIPLPLQIIYLLPSTQMITHNNLYRTVNDIYCNLACIRRTRLLDEHLVQASKMMYRP